MKFKKIPLESGNTVKSSQSIVVTCTSTEPKPLPQPVVKTLVQSELKSGKSESEQSIALLTEQQHPKVVPVEQIVMDDTVKLVSKIVTTNESGNSKPVIRTTTTGVTLKLGETEQPLTLIDPVTGELTVVRQSKEGQYVPVPGVKAIVSTGTSININVQSAIKSEVTTTMATVSTKQASPSVIGTTPVTLAKTLVTPTKQQTVTLIKPVAQSTPAMSAIQATTKVQQPSMLPSQVPTAPSLQIPPVNVTPQPAVVQQILQQPKLVQQQQLRTHPLKAHVLNSQVNKVMNAALPSPAVPTQSLLHASQQLQQQQGQQTQQQQQQQQVGVVKVLSTSTLPTHQVQHLGKPNTTSYIVQSSAVKQNLFPRTSSPIVGPQHVQSLHVNVASGSITTGQTTTLSPRIQTSKLVAHQTLVEAHQQQQQLQKQTTGLSSVHGSPIVIHSSKQPIQTLGPTTGYSAIVQGGKTTIVQQSQSKQSTSISMPPSTATIQQITKQQHPQLQVTSRNIQQHHLIQQTVTTQIPNKTNISGLNVVTSQQQQQQIVKQQQLSSSQLPHIHATSNKIHSTTIATHHQIPQQTIQQASGSQHIMTCGTPPSALVAAHQPGTATAAGKIVVHQQQQPSQLSGGVANKTSISLQQVPQIMTGAVASPPLKQSHLSSQQPIVTGLLFKTNRYIFS